MKKTLLGFVLVLGFGLQAQIAHLDMEALKSEMPEIAVAASELKAYKASLQSEGEKMVLALQKEYARLERLVAGGCMSWELQKKLVAEFKLKQDSIELFEENMISMVQIKETQLFNPIEERIDSAVKAVAEENQLQYVMNQASPTILFNDTTTNVNSFVKSKLGMYTSHTAGNKPVWNLNLQGRKLGYLNLEELKGKMPEIAAAKSELELFRVQLQSQGEEMLAELQVEYNLFLKRYGQSCYPEKINPDVYTHLKIKEEEINKFSENMESMIENKKTQLLNPIHEKINSAIKVVAIENEFHCIINKSSNLILFYDDTADVSALVRGKLGM